MTYTLEYLAVVRTIEPSVTGMIILRQMSRVATEVKVRNKYT